MKKSDQLYFDQTLMKKIFLGIIILMIFSQRLTAQEHNFDSPAAYNNFIVMLHNNVTAKNLEYISQSVHSDDIRRVEQSRKDVINEIGQAIGKLAAIGPYEGDPALRDVGLEVLKLNLETFQLDFMQINQMKESRYDSFEALEKYFKAEDQAEKKLAETANRFREAQADFAAKNKLKLASEADPENQAVIERINKLNTYTRIVFLQYFKVSRINAKFWDAINVKEARQAEELRKEMVDASTRSVAYLEKLSGFKDDTRYRDAALDLLKYFQQLSLNELKDLTRYQYKLDHAEAVTTQEEVNEYNKMTQRYNEIIQEYNGKTQALINRMNAEQQGLLQRHIPKPSDQTGIMRI